MLELAGATVRRNGKDHLIISGAIHYFRVHPEQWRDRLRSLRLMGANTVETYVAWNFHAPAPDVVEFEGARDLGRFLDIAAEEDLDVIVRPGPYICAEWENGGFPGWFTGQPGMRLRCMDERYLAGVDKWFDELIPVIAARQPEQGGRVVMVQVENEYGSYGQDKEYLAHLRDGMIARGITVPLVTSDGPGDIWLDSGTVEGVHPTINFGSRTKQYLEEFRAKYPNEHPMCMEFWNGWFDHWGQPHHTRDAASAAQELDDMLSGGMSVNFYMAHGGTNFGMLNGCNHSDGKLGPTTTSYDYDAAISEDGTWSEKFHAFREVIGRYAELPELPEQPERRVQPAARLEPVGQAVLDADAFETLSRAVVDQTPGLKIREEKSPFPPTFEDLGLERGLMLLRATLLHPGGEWNMTFHGLRDQAHVYLNGTLVGIVGRDEGQPEQLAIEAEAGEHQLDLIVESFGRVNFGPLVGETKGLTKGAWFGTHFVMGWQAYPLALDLATEAIVDALGEISGSQEGFTRVDFDLEVEDPSLDTYLMPEGFGRGFMFLGDFMLGRYDHRGPQGTLYVPAPLLQQGTNRVTLVETEQVGQALNVLEAPVLDVNASE